MQKYEDFSIPPNFYDLLKDHLRRSNNANEKSVVRTKEYFPQGKANYKSTKKGTDFKSVPTG